MSSELPSHYFRLRENGAAVFKVDTENRQRRLELIEIAFINLRNGHIRPHGEQALSDDDQQAIAQWLLTRRALQEQRDRDDATRLIDQINITTQWLQSRAGADDLDHVGDSLLLAMHDLRSVIVRRKAEQITQQKAAADQAG